MLQFCKLCVFVGKHFHPYTKHFAAFYLRDASCEDVCPELKPLFVSRQLFVFVKILESFFERLEHFAAPFLLGVFVCKIYENVYKLSFVKSAHNSAHYVSKCLCVAFGNGF